MAEPTQINLSRALKLKNRVVHQLSRLDAQITLHNSAIDGQHEYDTRKSCEQRAAVVDQLVALKVAINAANQPIQHFIFELAERKALVAMLGKVVTTHGVATEGYSGVKTNYVAQLRKPDIDREIRRVEQDIDRLQDELDRFNQRTMIAVDASLLADPAPAAETTR